MGRGAARDSDDTPRYPAPVYITEDGDRLDPNVEDTPDTPLDDLSSMERAFLVDFVENGDAALAARMAGYSRNVQACASVLLNKPAIRKALKALRATRRESLRETTEIGARMGRQFMIHVMADGEAPLQQRLYCASQLSAHSAVTPGRDMSDDLTDDAALEKINSKKMQLALVEFEQSNQTTVDTKNGNG